MDDSGSGNTSYLSLATCDEFISILVKEVATEIVNELHIAKFFSFSVDSTPDIKHFRRLWIVRCTGALQICLLTYFHIATNFLLQCDTCKSTVYHVSTFLASSKIPVINRNSWQRLSLNVFEIMISILTIVGDSHTTMLPTCQGHIQVTGQGEGG